MEKDVVQKIDVDGAVGDFQPIPFYFLNDDVHRPEILRQLNFMKKNGIKAFFLHVRDGITGQAFGTDFFFDNVKYIVKEAAKRDIKVWLYDEDAYPSGNCGGLTVINRPELQARNLCVEKVTPDEKGIARLCIGNGIGLYGYILTQKEGKTQVKRVENCFGSVRRTWYQRKLDKHYFPDMGDLHFEHTRAATCYTEVMFELQATPEAEVYCVYQKPVATDVRFGTQASSLDRRATDYFIERVHEKYKKYVGDYFGNVIPGIFLDEPCVLGTGYCEELEPYFEKRFGYAAKDHFYKLSGEFEGESAKFRRDYSRALSELFRKNFLQPLKDWCGENGLIFTGHFAGEENLSSQAHGGDLYRAIGMMDIPGMDLIGNDVGDLEHCSLLIAGKVVSSAAWQQGKDVVMSESFALNPYNFGYQGMKLNADWQYACGVNLIVPHGFHYGYSAFRRADAGKSFFFQDPLFDEYKRFATYAGRVGKILHQYRAQNDTLVVLPISACAEEMLKYRQNAQPLTSERMKKILDRTYNVVKLLYAYHVAWDVAYPDAVLSGKLVSGSLIVGERSYKKVIVIEGGDEELEVYKRLNGVIQDLTYCSFSGRLTLTDKLLTGLQGNVKQLLVLKKYAKNGQLYFIFNNSREYVKFTFKEKEHLCVYDAEEDKYFSLGKNHEIALNGYQSIILVTEEVKCVDRYPMPEPRAVSLEYKEHPERIYKPIGCKQAITKFDLFVGTEKKRYKNVGFSRLRDVLGTRDEIYADRYMIPYFDTAPRIPSPYPVKASYVAKVPCLGGGILLDKDTVSGEYTLLFNGKEVPKDAFKPLRIYDESNIIFYPNWKEGENELEIRFEKGGEFDGINGEFFVMEEGITEFE